MVVDTGSEDNTVEIAKKYTDKVFTDYVWQDSFAEARNQAISKCTGDWILTIDCDCKLDTPVSVIKEEIERAEKMGEKAINVKCLNMAGTHSHYLPLVYKKDPEVYWKGAAHNHLTADVLQPEKDIVISYWWSDSHTKDPDRTLRILKKEVAKNPEKGREIFYLAREYLYRGDYITALYWYNKYIPKSQYGAEECEAYLQMARCHWNIQEGNLARGFCLQAIGLNTNFKEALLFMAEMSGPKNSERWTEFAQTANNNGVLFLREKEEQPSNYYDNYYKDRPSLAKYDEIYQEIGKLVGDKSVLDIGCGYADISKYIENYQGFDFSEEAVKIGKEKIGDKIWVGSAYDKENYKKADCYVATEILEHTDDYKVIANIPEGARFIFTVPNFNDPAHLRTYTEEIIKSRYKDILDVKIIIPFNWIPKKEIWILGGERSIYRIYLVEAVKKPIKRVYYNEDMKTFGEKMLRFMGYQKYDPKVDLYNPVFFQGLYYRNDYEVFKAHKGEKTVFWNGSDVLRLLQNPHWIKWLKENPTKHLCQSVWNIEKLASVGIEAEHYPIFFGDINNYPVSYKQSDKPQVFMTSHEGRGVDYGTDVVLRIAPKVSDIIFHIYGEDGKNTENVIYHGFVNEGIMNKEIKNYQGALKFGTNGISQTLAKSIFMGQYPISSAQIDGVINAPTDEDLIRELNKLKTYKKPNYKLRDKYLKYFRYGE